MRKIIITAVVALIMYAGVAIVLDMKDTITNNCVANGEQRMVNSIDGLMVEDKLVCNGGRVKWSRQYQ